MPEHNRYVELCGGAAALLFAKEPSEIEIYNDVCGNISTFLRVLKNPNLCARLITRLDRATPSQELYELARSSATNINVVARAFNVYVMGKLAANGIAANGWIRQDSRDKTRNNFRTYRTTFEPCSARLANVQILQSSFEQLIFRHDVPGAFFYIDPPYPLDVRKRDNIYRHEMSRADHLFLLACLQRMKHARIMLSGYDCPMYHERLVGWRVERKRVHCHSSWRKGKRPTRVEVLWMNY